MYKHPLHVFMISLHGLVRGCEPELGRDADTGGQITYVLDLARSLGRHPDVRRVDLLTRLIEDPQVSADYAQPLEPIGKNANILRLPFGPKRYIRKELLWNYLDSLVDRCLHYLREQGQVPDVIHSHYADAGYVGLQLSQLLGIPQIHTGHSLGRCKRQRLLDSGRAEQAIERQFNFLKRIEAEEQVLDNADLVITSTRQERDEQYGMYENFHASRCLVLPPGIDFSRFSLPGRKLADEKAEALLDRFFDEPDKPLILTISRPAPRKNLSALLDAYGESKALQQVANLAIVVGQRDDLSELEESQRQVLTELILGIDRHDLYGKVALPKRHNQEDVPRLYRLAAKRRGVFINPGLTEPFGLTLLEAAASGLPIASTEDGGPRDIVANCRNGLLFDALDRKAIAATLLEMLGDKRHWRNWSQNGRQGVVRHYSWVAHTDAYVEQLCRLLHKNRKKKRRSLAIASTRERSPLPLAQWVFVSDVDNTLLGDAVALGELLHWLAVKANDVAFGIATGRSLESAVKVLRQSGVRAPDVLITSVGSEIYYGPNFTRDEGWIHYIRHQWRRDDLTKALKGLAGLRLQRKLEQGEFKLSYLANLDKMPSLSELRQRLHEANLHANIIFSHDRYLDVLPARASKGHALRYLAYKWGVPLGRFLVAGDSGNDVEMMTGDTLGVVVGNHSEELAKLRGEHQVFFASSPYARGILEGMDHYGFGTSRDASLVEVTGMQPIED